MQKQALLYSGKAKSVYKTEDPNHLVLAFRNDTSAFDGTKLAQLDRKGQVNNQFNAHVMQLLAANGVATHFDELISPNESLVKALEMIPVECVVRNAAAGQLSKRLGLEEGTPLNPPVFEFFLKDDALHDPMINESHIATFGWATPDEVEQMKTITAQVNAILRPWFEQAGLLLIDYKLEFGRFEGQLLLGDEFTPDGCRIWDAATGKKFDKDRFRRDLGDVVESYEEAAKRLGIDLNSQSR